MNPCTHACAHATSRPDTPTRLRFPAFPSRGAPPCHRLSARPATCSRDRPPERALGALAQCTSPLPTPPPLIPAFRFPSSASTPCAKVSPAGPFPVPLNCGMLPAPPAYPRYIPATVRLGRARGTAAGQSLLDALRTRSPASYLVRGAVRSAACVPSV